MKSRRRKKNRIRINRSNSRSKHYKNKQQINQLNNNEIGANMLQIEFESRRHRSHHQPLVVAIAIKAPRFRVKTTTRTTNRDFNRKNTLNTYKSIKCFRHLANTRANGKKKTEMRPGKSFRKTASPRKRRRKNAVRN